MNQGEKEEYINYRIDKANETLEVAELLIKHEKWNSSVNRLYYAAYYAVSALLVKAALDTKTHTGVKTQFYLHFVKQNIIDTRLGKVYSDLFDWRQKGDYGDFFDFTEKDVLSILNPTKELIEKIKEEINKTE